MKESMKQIISPKVMLLGGFCIVLIAFITELALRAIYLDVSDMDRPIISDHFINAITAKNIAAGHGWSSSGFQLYLFDPQNLTTGPAIIYPLSGFISLFGNSLYLPSTAMLLINLVYLCVLLLILWRHKAQNGLFYSFFFILLAINLYPYFWIRVLGEIASVCLLISAAFLINSCITQRNTGRLLFAGVLLGFSVMGKQLALLGCLGLIFSYCILSYAANRQFKHSLCASMTLLALMLLPVMAFNLHKNSQLSTMPPDWLMGYKAYAEIVFDFHSGIDTVKRYITFEKGPIEWAIYLFNHAWQTFSNLLYAANFPHLALCFFILYFSGLTAALINYKHSMESLLLYSINLPLFLWFFFMDEIATERYAYIALFTGLFAIFSCFNTLPNKKIRHILNTILCLFVIVIGWASEKTFFNFSQEKSAYALSVEQADAFMKKHDAVSYSWLGAWDAVDFEYLHNGVNRFINLADVVVDAVEFDEQAYLAKYPAVKELVEQGQYDSGYAHYTDHNMQEFHFAQVNFVSDFDAYWIHKKGTRTGTVTLEPFSNFETGEFCEKVYYQNDFWIIEHCTEEDFQRLFRFYGGMPFRPISWLYPQRNMPAERGDIF